MAYLKYRGTTSSPGTWTSTTSPGAPLSNLDIDKNFASLDAQKIDVTGGTISSGTFAIGSSATFEGNLKDDKVTFVDGNDTSKKLTLQLSGIATSTTRTLTIPNANGTIALTDQLNKQDIALDNTTNSSLYITFVASSSGAQAGKTSSNLRWNPSSSTFTITGELEVSGNINNTSDIRFKKDIQLVSDALNKINSINGYTFTFTETEKRSAGLIAQEVEAVLPEVISGNEEKKTLNYSGTIALLVEAIKELNAKVEDLQNQLNNK